VAEIRIRLNGGPPGFPDGLRERTVAPEDLDDHVKVAFLAGHEHFEYSAETTTTDAETASPTTSPQDEETPPLVRQYRWAYRTRIAE